MAGLGSGPAAVDMSCRGTWQLGPSEDTVPVAEELGQFGKINPGLVGGRPDAMTSLSKACFPPRLFLAICPCSYAPGRNRHLKPVSAKTPHVPGEGWGNNWIT